MAHTLNLVVLFSGKGSNLETLIERFHRKKIGEREVRVFAVTNRPNAGGIARARHYGIEPIVLDHTLFASREEFDEMLADTVASLRPDLVVMAGFMRILTPRFTERIEAINLHPSLLPLFRGTRAIEKSFKSGMKVGGVTVHRVTAELDSGEILDQACVKIEPIDTIESFTEKIHRVEHTLLPDVVERLLSSL
ncbi:phosphoribosylglycinamide formyltransferase [Hydrogenimonas sp.]